MDREEFEEKKVQVVMLIQHLEDRVDVCVELGMRDQDSVLYNHVDDLLEGAQDSEDPMQLSEIVSKSKVVETNLDRWLISKGQTTVGLFWPSLEEEG